MWNKCSFVIQLLMLAALVAPYLVHKKQKPKHSGSGRLTVIVYRMVSESVLYDISPPNLYLEIEAAGEVKKTDTHYRVREAIVMESFIFDSVNYHGAILFRLKDDAFESKPSRGLLAITPSEAELGKTHVYKMEGMNWLLMRIEWLAVENGKSIPVPR